MHNLKHYNPELKAGNVTAISHGSKQDTIIYQGLLNYFEELSYQALIIESIIYNSNLDDINNSSDLEGIV